MRLKVALFLLAPLILSVAGRRRRGYTSQEEIAATVYWVYSLITCLVFLCICCIFCCNCCSDLVGEVEPERQPERGEDRGDQEIARDQNQQPPHHNVNQEVSRDVYHPPLQQETVRGYF